MLLAFGEDKNYTPSSDINESSGKKKMKNKKSKFYKESELNCQRNNYLIDVKETKPRRGCRHDQSNTIIIGNELKTIRMELKNGQEKGKLVFEASIDWN